MATEARCPSCGSNIGRMPRRRAVCTSCGQAIHVRSSQRLLPGPLFNDEGLQALEVLRTASALDPESWERVVAHSAAAIQRGSSPLVAVEQALLEESTFLNPTAASECFLRLAFELFRFGGPYRRIIHRSKQLELEGVARWVQGHPPLCELHPVEIEYCLDVLNRFNPLTEMHLMMAAMADAPAPPPEWVPQEFQYVVETLAHTDACPACKKQEGHPVPFEQYLRHPLLPCPGCTCPGGDPRGGLCACCLFTTKRRVAK